MNTNRNYETKIIKDPSILKMPTLEEYNEHCKTHVPFKSWCRICVKNQAPNNPPTENLLDMNGTAHLFQWITCFCTEIHQSKIRHVQY